MSKRGWHGFKVPRKDSDGNELAPTTVQAKTLWLEVPGTGIEVKFALHKAIDLNTEFLQLTHYASGLWVTNLGDESYITGLTDDRALAQSALKRLVDRHGADEVLRRMREAPELNEPHKERKTRRKHHGEAA